MAKQKCANFDKLFNMYTDMTAVTIQSNKIVSMTLKTAKCTRAILWKKNRQTFWPTQYFHGYITEMKTNIDRYIRP